MSTTSNARPSSPTPPQRPKSAVGNYLWIAFIASLAIHLVAGIFYPAHNNQREDSQPETVAITKKIKVVVPTPPPPTPTPPPPTPPPKSTPPPVTTTAPPPVKKLKLDVVKTHSNDKTAPTENTYVPPPKGDENGVPQGNAATGAPVPVKTGPPSTLPPATAPPPTAPPTPAKPVCAVPNQEAAVVNKVDPDYPDAARAAGASGSVRVQVNLTESGAVAGVSVYQSSGNSSLDQAALAAARQSTYQPEIEDCTKTAKSYIFVASFESQ